MFYVLFSNRSWVFNSGRFPKSIQAGGSQVTRKDYSRGFQVRHQNLHMLPNPLIYYLLLQVFGFMENTSLYWFFTSEHFRLIVDGHAAREKFIVSYSGTDALGSGCLHTTEVPKSVWQGWESDRKKAGLVCVFMNWPKPMKLQHLTWMLVLSHGLHCIRHRLHMVLELPGEKNWVA